MAQDQEVGLITMCMFKAETEVEVITKKIRGRDERLTPLFEVEFITKKNRGREGRLAPACLKSSS